MASVVAGGLFNTVAFSKLNHLGYSEEITCHNHALEQLAKAKQEWYEHEVVRKDHIAQLERQLRKANQDLNLANKAPVQLSQYQSTVTPEPKLSDHYQPSQEMQHYPNLAVGTLGLVTGVGLVRFLGMFV